MYYYQVNNVNA